MGFVHGLGFDDFRALLNSMTANVGGFDFAGFAKGLGEGIRATVDAIRPLLSAFGGGAGDAETVGRLAAELFGLSISLHAIGPVVAIVSAVASGFLALRAALAGLSTLSELSGLTGALRALVGIEAATAATGLLAMAGALTAIGAAVQGLLSAGILNPIHLRRTRPRGKRISSYGERKRMARRPGRHGWIGFSEPARPARSCRMSAVVRMAPSSRPSRRAASSVVPAVRPQTRSWPACQPASLSSTPTRPAVTSAFCPR